MEAELQVGDYIRIDWTIPEFAFAFDDRFHGGGQERQVWVEGEIRRIHRPTLDLVADILVDRSNFLSIGSVQGIGIARGARRIPRPATVSTERADGFSQAAIDAAKAVLLSPATTRPRR